MGAGGGPGAAALYPSLAWLNVHRAGQLWPQEGGLHSDLCLAVGRHCPQLQHMHTHTGPHTHMYPSNCNILANFTWGFSFKPHYNSRSQRTIYISNFQAMKLRHEEVKRAVSDGFPLRQAGHWATGPSLGHMCSANVCWAHCARHCARHRPQSSAQDQSLSHGVSSNHSCAPGVLGTQHSRIALTMPSALTFMGT